MNTQKIDLGKRMVSMILDHFVMSFLVVPILIIFKIVLDSTNDREVVVGAPSTHEIDPVMEILFLVAMFLIYLNKDFVNGRSFAKRVIGMQVLNNKNELPANELQCYLRNITIPIWPLEVFVTLISPKRRIGDLIANTRVEQVEKSDPKSLFKELKQKKITKTTVFTLLTGIIYMALMWYILDQVLQV